MDTTINSNLLRNEEILWSGQPNLNGRSASSGTSAPTRVFGIVWLTFSLFWTAIAFISTVSDDTTSLTSFLFPLFGMPFVAIGIFIVFIAPKKQKEKNLSTFYYITDKRIIINICANNASNFYAVYFKDIKSTNIIKNRDNTGNIIFDQLLQKSSVYSSSTPPIPSPSNCFYRIESVDDVYTLLKMRQEISDLKEDRGI